MRAAASHGRVVKEFPPEKSIRIRVLTSRSKSSCPKVSGFIVYC